MSRNGPEHRRGWHDRFEADGVPVEIHARHYARHRLPRGHEIARQAVRGLPHAMVEEIDHEWTVAARGRAVLTLRQDPGGDFRSGHLSFPRMDIRAAAEAALRRLAPGVLAPPRGPAGPSPAPAPDEPGSAPPGP